MFVASEACVVADTSETERQRPNSNLRKYRIARL